MQQFNRLTTNIFKIYRVFSILNYVRINMYIAFCYAANIFINSVMIAYNSKI